MVLLLSLLFFSYLHLGFQINWPRASVIRIEVETLNLEPWTFEPLLLLWQHSRRNAIFKAFSMPMFSTSFSPMGSARLIRATTKLTSHLVFERGGPHDFYLDVPHHPSFGVQFLWVMGHKPNWDVNWTQNSRDSVGHCLVEYLNKCCRSRRGFSRLSPQSCPTQHFRKSSSNNGSFTSTTDQIITCTYSLFIPGPAYSLDLVSMNKPSLRSNASLLRFSPLAHQPTITK